MEGDMIEDIIVQKALMAAVAISLVAMGLKLGHVQVLSALYLVR
jgi:hypothetical protein